MRTPVEISSTLDIPVEMRDGTVLYTDVYRPAGDGPFPVILIRTPYDKEDSSQALIQVDAFRAVRRGYAMVIQNCRGRYSSEGDFKPFHQEINDGYDTVEWCAAQPWSTGAVGMVGTSYVGATQWLAAISAPPHLKCIIPCFTAADYYEGWTYQGGAFQWGFMCNWVLPYFHAADLYRENMRTPLPDYEDRRVALAQAIDQMPRTIKTLPLSEFPIDHEISDYYREWLSHPSRGPWWEAVSIQDRHDKVAVPALNVGGWYDIFLEGTIENFTGVRAKGATEAARTGSKLVLGAWTHTTPPSAVSGAVDFGVMAGQAYTPISLDMDGDYLRFFDLHLKGIDDGFSEEPPVKIFVMGEDVWRSEQEWPLARTTYVDYFLHSGGDANSSSGDGSLSTVPPTDERADHYLYDPFHPVPTVGGQLCCYPSQLAPGAFDQRDVEQRADVLVFRTEPLEQDTEVTGHVTLTLWASTTAADTDFTGKLVDVYPDGYTRNLTDGIIRARYRSGTAQPDFVTPNEVVEYTIDLWATSNLFKAGHRIGLQVSSSNFPRFDRNLNTGGVLGEETEMKPALQTIHHDERHPSRLTLPIIPR